MSTKHTRGFSGAAPPKIPHDELARMVSEGMREGERLRAEAMVQLFRSAGRGVARLGRTFAAALAGWLRRGHGRAAVRRPPPPLPAASAARHRA